MGYSRNRAFTLVELLTALMIGAVILAAAAAMASAVSNGKTALERDQVDIAYLSSLQYRIADAVRRAETITPVANGVLLQYGNGKTIAIYKDALEQIWFEDSAGGTVVFKQQKAVSIEQKSPKRVEIKLVLEQNGQPMPYRFTVCRYAGQ